MKNSSLALALLLSLPSFALGQATPGPRRTEPAENPALQAALTSSHAGYRAFLEKAGGAWIVRFDAEGGTPSSIVGSGIAVSARPIATLAEASAAARATLERFPELWGAPIEDLHLVQAEKVHRLYVFTWQQRFLGLDVERATVQIQVHEAGRVASLASAAFAMPGEFSRMPQIDADAAVARVSAGKRLAFGDTIEAADFLVYVARANAVSAPHLAYRVDVNQPSAQVYERVFVDANDGSILEVAPSRFDLFDVKGNVSGLANTSLSPSAAPVSVPIGSATVTVSGVGTATTDANGDWVIATGAAGPFNVSAKLQGAFYNVLPAQGALLNPSGTTTNVGGADVANLVFNPVPSQFSSAQASGAYLHNVIRTYDTTKIPTFVPFASQLVNVNQFSTCNAFYSQADNSINFYASGGGCPNTVYSTIAYHEYGHGVDDRFGGIPNFGLSEALGDVNSMYATDQPIIGADFFGPGLIIRTGLNNTVWPAPQCGGESHCVGETFMGFAWHARLNLKASLGDAAAIAVSEVDFLGTFPFNNTSIPNAVTQVFVLDDDDGDLTNGTPHYGDLASAATLKGFTPPAISLLAAPLSYAAGTAPYAGAFGDLNADGAPDAAVTNSAPGNTISVMLGNGAGVFGAPATFTVGSSPQSIVAADVNADGKLDLLTANFNSGNVSVLLGDGAGGFAPATSAAAGNHPFALVVADLSGDGVPDLATANAFGNDVTVMVGLGGGTFGVPLGNAAGGSPQSLAVGDLNADGKPDLAAANLTSNNVSVLLGVGGGNFAAAANFAVGTFPVAVAMGDVNFDGKPDLVTANSFSNNLSVLAGNGAGSFGAATTISGIVSPSWVAIGDVTRDGRPDVVASSLASNNVALMIASGTTLGAPVAFASGAAPSFVALADLDADGKADVVTVNSGNNSISALHNQSVAPAGFASYGTGTPGCRGTLGMSINVAPKVNQPAFGFTCSNAPKSTLGLGLLTNVQDAAGSDSLGLGAKFHVDLFAATFVQGINFISDAGGSGFAASPIPNSPTLAGQTLYAQAAWVESAANGLACGPSVIDLVTSKGESILIAP